MSPAVQPCTRMNTAGIQTRYEMPAMPNTEKPRNNSKNSVRRPPMKASRDRSDPRGARPRRSGSRINKNSSAISTPGNPTTRNTNCQGASTPTPGTATAPMPSASSMTWPPMINASPEPRYGPIA